MRLEAGYAFLFAVIIEVNMLKYGKKLKYGFAFKDLLNNISKIGWLRYILSVVSLVVVWLSYFTSTKVADFIDINLLLLMSFFARTISLLYDHPNPSLSPPQ
jgi:hypothetical protein